MNRKCVTLKKIEYVLPENYLCYEHPYHSKPLKLLGFSGFFILKNYEWSLFGPYFYEKICKNVKRNNKCEFYNR